MDCRTHSIIPLFHSSTFIFLSHTIIILIAFRYPFVLCQTQILSKMRNVNNYFLGILAVCLLSGVFLFMSTMALQDIYNGDLEGFTKEWNVVRLSFVVNGLLYLFIIVTFLKFRRLLKRSH